MFFNVFSKIYFLANFFSTKTININDKLNTVFQYDLLDTIFVLLATRKWNRVSLLFIFNLLFKGRL